MSSSKSKEVAIFATNRIHVNNSSNRSNCRYDNYNSGEDGISSEGERSGAKGEGEKIHQDAA